MTGGPEKKTEVRLDGLVYPAGSPDEFEIECGMGVSWMNRRMGP
jgi:hypothetical protein